jgi:hypothetical protein
MSDTIRTQRDPAAHERAEPRGRTANRRYVVTFSVSDYETLREWVSGPGKVVTVAEVKAILRQRMHYE